MQFEISKQKAKVASFNPRSELNGEDRRPAADVKLEMPMNADALAMFSPNLRASWYAQAGEGDLPTLRVPELEGPFAFAGEMVQSIVTLHTGVRDITLAECTINAFRLTPLDGGTVVVTCRVQCHPDELAAGRLCALVQGDLEVSIDSAQGKLDL